VAPGALIAFLDNRYVAGSSTPVARTDAAGNAMFIVIAENVIRPATLRLNLLDRIDHLAHSLRAAMRFGALSARYCAA